MIYIVPYSFFYNTHARYLRQALLHYGSIEVVIDLDESRLFVGENPETIIFRFRRGKRPEPFAYLRVKRRYFTPEEIEKEALETLACKRETEFFSYATLPHPTSSGRWSLSESNVSFSSQPLKAVAKVGVGLVSGLDVAFRIEEAEIGLLNSEERALLHPLVKAQHCRTHRVQGYTWYFIPPPTLSEETLQERLPYFFHRLRLYYEGLRKRYLPRSAKWFHWQALRNYGFLQRHLHRKRLYIPTLTRQDRVYFALGEGGLWPSGDVLFIQPYEEKDTYWLYAYLNSDFFWRYYLRQGLRRGGRHVFTQRILEELMVPVLSKSLQMELSAIGQAYEERRDTDILREVEGFLNKVELKERQISLL